MKTQKNKTLLVVLMVIFLALNFHVNAQSVKEGTFYTLAVDPTFGGRSMSNVTVPPVALYFERGVADFLSFGIAAGTDIRKSYSYSDETWVSLGLTLRAVGYAFQAMEAFSDEEVTIAGLEPYFGFTFGQYWPSISQNYGSYLNYNKLGIVLGTRWYPGDKKSFGVMAEYTSAGNTGWGSGINVGVTFGR